MKKLILSFVLMFSIFLSFPFYVSAQQQSYTFGLHPFQSYTKLSKMFKLFVGYMKVQLDSKIEFKRFNNYEDTIDSIVAGEVDISYMGPAAYAIVSAKHPGKIRLVAAIENKVGPIFKGVIVVKKDSPINSLKDLKNKKFAFGDRKSTLSCYVPAYMLINEGVFDSMTYKFHGSHDKVGIAVYRNVADAGGMKPAVAKEFVKKGYLKIIAESEPIYDHVFVVGPKVSDKDYRTIKQALLNVKNPSIYTSIKSSLVGFTEVNDANYNNLRKIISSVDEKLPQ